MSDEGLKKKQDLEITTRLGADSAREDPDEITDSSPLVQQAMRDSLPADLAENARLLEEKIEAFRNQLALFGVDLGPDRAPKSADHLSADVEAGFDEETRALLRAAEQEFADAVIARSEESTPETRERCSRALENWDRIRSSGRK
jgi:hypothetical protein